MLPLKRGDTLSLSGFLPEGFLPAGEWSARCKVVDKKGGQRFDVSVTLNPPTGDETRYFLRLYAPASATATWPARKLFSDIEFTDASAEPAPYVFSSMDFVIDLLEDRA